MEMLILVPKITNRLLYIFELLLKEELGIDFKLTAEVDEFLSYQGMKLHYDTTPLNEEPALFQQAAKLLFERDIYDQDIKVCSFNDTNAIYPVFNDNSLFPFDIFAASFYIISRYEEYLPHVSDQYNRFQPQDSILYKMNTIEKPIVNIWAIELGKVIKARYPEVQLKKKTFKFVPTYDIDAAWAYKNKGVFRTTAAFLKDMLFFDKKEIKERWDVLRDKRIDPFDTFDYQIELQKELKLKPLYFILCGDYNTNDKNISIRNKEFQKLIKRLGDYALVGIHPSFSSYLKKNVIKEEVNRLSEVLNREVTMSRQHFLRLSLPSTYQILIELDITDDYSMGYASQAGFRAGYADTFQFFDLENDMKTKLNIHPFALMDGTMRDYLDLDVHESYEKAKQLVDEVKNVNGTFILLWHNETLSGEKRWEGWITLYRKILDYIMN
jgi:predicted MPP superfamily phosphohydrolase